MTIGKKTLIQSTMATLQLSSLTLVTAATSTASSTRRGGGNCKEWNMELEPKFSLADRSSYIMRN